KSYLLVELVSFSWKLSSIVVQFKPGNGLEVRSVLPQVTEHPDSDSGKREFKSLMKFNEFTLQTPPGSNPSEDVSSAGYLISKSYQCERFNLCAFQ
ncbi:hypothetical protein Tco_0930381, partial [Tanacetum coccineum]